MIIKNIQNLIAGLVLVVLLAGCTAEEISINEIEFFIAKEWKIESVIVNGEPVTDTDLSQYRLTLNKDFTFTRVTIDGKDEAGEWKLTAGLSQFVLFVNDPREEHYLVLDLAVRRLEMRILQDSFKQGELDIRYILIPVKGQ